MIQTHDNWLDRISLIEKQESLVIRNTDARAKLPGFKSQLYHFLAVQCGQLFNLSVPQLPYPYNGDSTCTYVIDGYEIEL